MADPSIPASPGPLSPRGGQIRQAFRDLLEPASPLGSGPLCLITPGGRSLLLGELAAWAQAHGRKVFLREGSHLGREISQATSAGCWDRFRRKVMETEIVVIEHVEAIGSRSRLEGFRHLLDAAHNEGIRFCLSLATHPANGHLPPDLAGRLAAGLLLPLAPARPVLPACARAIHPDSSAAATRRQPSLKRIITATARHFGIATETLVGPSRSRTVCQARSLAIYLARQLTDRSFAAIGAACGNRDHTTALHGMRIASTRIATDPAAAADAAAVAQALDVEPVRRNRNQTVSVDCR